jgi:hypothetical protein
MNYITRVLLLTVSIGVVVDCNALADSPAGGPTPSVGEAKNAAEQSSKPHEVIIQKDGASPEELSTFAKGLERA